MIDLLQRRGIDTALLGMVHLGPLPGAPRVWEAEAHEVIDAAIQDASRDVEAILSGGMDGVVIENFGDVPFYRDRVPPITVAAMARVATRLAEQCASAIVGINVLRNDASAALAIAAALNLAFIRVNVHSGAMVTDQGIIEGRAHETMRERENLPTSVKVLADVLVKHAIPLGGATADIDPAAIAKDTAYRGRADGLIVTGAATGSAVDIDRLRTVREAVPDRALFVGSGVRPENAAELASLADGLIVGTSIKDNEEVRRPVSIDRVRRIVRAVRGGQ